MKCSNCQFVARRALWKWHHNQLLASAWTRKANSKTFWLIKGERNYPRCHTEWSQLAIYKTNTQLVWWCPPGWGQRPLYPLMWGCYSLGQAPATVFVGSLGRTMKGQGSSWNRKLSTEYRQHLPGSGDSNCPCRTSGAELHYQGTDTVT